MEYDNDQVIRVIRKLVAKHYDVNAYAMNSADLAAFFRFLPISALDGYDQFGIHMECVLQYRNMLGLK